MRNAIELYRAQHAGNAYPGSKTSTVGEGCDTVPSWAAQTVVRTIERNFPAYAYKEAALNPTNPADRATDWEADIIRIFRREAELSTLLEA